MKKWKRYHTTQTPPRQGQPSKLSCRTSRKLVWDVTVNPTTTLKDLQGSMSEMGVSVHQSTISRYLPKAGLHVAINKLLLKKTHPKACMELLKKES